MAVLNGVHCHRVLPALSIGSILTFFVNQRHANRIQLSRQALIVLMQTSPSGHDGRPAEFLQRAGQPDRLGGVIEPDVAGHFDQANVVLDILVVVVLVQDEFFHSENLLASLADGAVVLSGHDGQLGDGVFVAVAAMSRAHGVFLRECDCY